VNGTPVSKRGISRITAGKLETVEDELAREVPLTIYVNDEEFATLLCSPLHQKELAVGFILSQGIISRFSDIEAVKIYNETEVRIWTAKKEKVKDLVKNNTITIASGGSRLYHDPVDVTACSEIDVKIDLQLDSPAVENLMQDFGERSVFFHRTGAFHSAALAARDGIIVIREDIGRHNALDKVLGYCLLEGCVTRDKVLLTSGRISSEMLLKAARQQIPVLISRSAPTVVAVDTARELGITLLGFARGKRFNVYSHPQRIASAQEG